MGHFFRSKIRHVAYNSNKAVFVSYIYWVNLGENKMEKRIVLFA